MHRRIGGTAARGEVDMRKWILVVPLFVMAGILWGAFTIDCTRLTLQKRDEVDRADAAMKVSETRLVRTFRAGEGHRQPSKRR